MNSQYRYFLLIISLLILNGCGVHKKMGSTDLFNGDAPALPTHLKNGYLLDNRGIGIHVAFLTYSYETYHALSKAPEPNQLMDSLLDRNPLAELWDCGSRSLYKNEVDELNALIDSGFPNGKTLIEVMSVTSKKTQP